MGLITSNKIEKAQNKVGMGGQISVLTQMEFTFSIPV
jgi:hypothetical protein